MGSDPVVLAEEERALIDRLARRVVELHMEVPAILALESAKPLSFVASQALVFFEPMVQSLFSFPEYRRVTRLLERRETVEFLIQAIEAGAAARPGRGRTTPGAGGAPPPRGR